MTSWTDDRVATLKKLWADGLSASEIAKQLRGVSRNAVLGKVDRLKLERSDEGAKETARLSKAMRPKKPRTDLGTWGRSGPPKEASPLPPERPHDGPVVAMEALTAFSCRWPIGQVGDPSFGFCGKPKPGGREHPYCAAHARIAFNPKAIPEKEFIRGLRRFS